MNKIVTISIVQDKIVVEYHGMCINTYASIQTALRHIRIHFEEKGSLSFVEDKPPKNWSHENKDYTLFDGKAVREQGDPAD